MKSRPKSKAEAKSLLPSSVSLRLETGPVSTLAEANVMVELAKAACGGWAGVLVAAECYDIPVQVGGGVAIEDVLWYMNLDMGGILSRFNTHVRVASALMAKRRGGLVDPYPTGRGFSERTKDKFKDYSKWTWWHGRAARDAFEVKKDIPSQKINLWFEDVWVDCVDYFPEVAEVVGKHRAVLRGARNDSATAWTLWLCGAFPTLGASAFGLAAALREEAAAIKELNTLVKALGLTACPWGPLVCELATMAGRGVAVPCQWDDIKSRVSRRLFERDKLARVDLPKLREAIRAVVRDEMVAKPVWQKKEDYWSRRWLYTKAGSHSRYPEKEWFGERLDLPPQPTRREFAEVCDRNMVALGKPRVDAGLSWKLEHGKTRAIYGCDSRSYFTFDYLLRPVEAVWRNNRVLLDPGRSPQATLYPRLAKKAGTRYMLDFDDFNSQHSLEAMQLCIEIACEGAPPEELSWALSSWKNMYVHWSDGSGMREKRMIGTLPSGHRATSFVNTILNAAYCRLVTDDLYSQLDSYHCGDDVVINGPESAISKVVKRFVKSPFRINPSKQSVGRHVGEFLRVSYTKSAARGYLARGVSSLVSGNWVTQNRLDKRSYVETVVRGAWTLCARSCTSGLGALCKRSLDRWVPELRGVSHELLTHMISLDGTPVRSRVHRRKVSVVRLRGGRATTRAPELSAYRATQEFMEKHVDYKLLEAAGVEPSHLRGAMLKASRKPREVVSVGDVGMAVDHCLGHLPLGSGQAFWSKEREDKGREEAMQLLRSLFSDIDWRALVASVRGGDQSLMSVTGQSEWPVLNEYELPFSDCMSVRRRLTWPTSLLVEYPVMV